MMPRARLRTGLDRGMSEGGEIVSIDSRWRGWRTVGLILAAVAGLSILVAACGDDDGDDGGGGGEGDGANLACGLGNGEPASGQPNDNGGINGRPLELLIETEQTDPGQIANAAVKLAETEKVLGFFGNFSIIEGSVNHTFYEQNGFSVLCAGIAPEAYSTPNMACVNMGPRYSSDGAVQAVIRQDVDKVVFDQSNVPGTEYIAAGPKIVADAAGVP